MSKFYALFETLFLFVLFIAINFIFFADSPGFFSFNPHPFWVIVLLSAFRHGKLSGVLAGLIAAGVYLTLFWWFGEKYFFEDLEFYLQPFLFVLLGGLVGHAVNHNLSTIQKLTTQLEKTNTELQQIENALSKLHQINQDLEKRLASRLVSLVTLYELAKKLESNDEMELLLGITSFLTKSSGATVGALYKRSAQNWQRVKWENQEQLSMSLPDTLFSESLVAKAGQQNKIVTQRHLLDQNLTPNQDPCLVAVPLGDGTTQFVFAIYEIPLLQLNQATINLLQFLADWSSRSLKRLSFYQSLKENEIFNSTEGGYSYSYFASRLKQEFQRCKTYYLPMALCLVSVDKFAQFSNEQRLSWRRALSQLLKPLLLDIDVLAIHPQEAFILLLSTATSKRLLTLKNQLQESFNLLTDHHQLKLVTVEFVPQMMTADQLLHSLNEECSKGNKT